MRSKNRIVVAAATTVLVLGAGSGLAAAGPTARPPRQGGNPRRRRPLGGGPPGAAAISTYLGLTQAELKTQLQSGKTCWRRSRWRRVRRLQRSRGRDRC